MSLGQELRVAPRRQSLARRAAVRACEALAVACGGRSWFRARHLRPPGLLVRRERVSHPSLPEALIGFRVVQLSDLHAGPFVRAGDLRAVVELANALQPDCIAITGDLITHRAEDAELVRADLAQLRAREGVFGVFGNHDYRGRREGEIAQRFRADGVRFLRNEGVRIERGDAAVCVVGVEDLEEAREIDLERARACVRPGDFEIALCHNPRGALAFVRPCCLAVLCGHSHGTQLDLPWLRRAGPPHPGLRVHSGSTAILVSRGLGSIGLPLRIGAPTELVVLELERGRA
ncbi:MAG: metallophosphoesterase [Planctomycetes bacterium]|nr:metallophosphoesterase [Planctomycetota bacterium]